VQSGGHAKARGAGLQDRLRGSLSNDRSLRHQLRAASFTTVSPFAPKVSPLCFSDSLLSPALQAATRSVADEQAAPAPRGCSQRRLKSTQSALAPSRIAEVRLEPAQSAVAQRNYMEREEVYVYTNR
jgi:hypothetical protein